MHLYQKMLEWKPEDPSIEIVAVTMWEKCGEGQELYELLVRQDDAFALLHAPLRCSRTGRRRLRLSRAGSISGWGRAQP